MIVYTEIGGAIFSVFKQLSAGGSIVRLCHDADNLFWHSEYLNSMGRISPKYDPIG